MATKESERTQEQRVKRILAAHRAHKTRGTLSKEVEEKYREAGLLHLLDARSAQNEEALANADEVIDFYKSEKKAPRRRKRN